jgi:hypothetical protein
VLVIQSLKDSQGLPLERVMEVVVMTRKRVWRAKRCTLYLRITVT